MKTYFFLFLIPVTLFFTSCQPDPPKTFPGAGANDTLATGHILDTSLTSLAYFEKILALDSALLKEMQQSYYHSSFGMSGYYANKEMIDSLLQVNVNLPTLFDSSMYSTVAITQFYTLANGTNGKPYFLEDSRRIGEKMINIIDTHLNDKTDLVFLIDKTSSMQDDIDKVKKSLHSIIARVREKKDVRLALATYGDKGADGTGWFEFMPFTDDFDKATDFVNSIQLTNGGDELESVFEGCVTMMDTLDWRKNANKMILLLGDAGGHLPPFAQYSVADVIQKSKEHGVLMNFYPVIISPLPTGVAGNVSSYSNTPLINTIFPVPTDGMVNVILGEEKAVEYGVFDINGREVQNGQSSDSKFVIDLGGQPNGVYIIRVSDPAAKKFEEKKIILSR